MYVNCDKYSTRRMNWLIVQRPSIRLFNVDSERHIFIFKKLFYGKFLPEIYWEEIADEIYFFQIFFRCLTWNTNPGFMSNNPTYNLLEYGDLMQ